MTSPETIVLAAAIAATLHLVRTRWAQLAEVWAQARWYERAALCVALAPIPGPVDELLGLLVIRRVVSRRKAAR